MAAHFGLRYPPCARKAPHNLLEFSILLHLFKFLLCHSRTGGNSLSVLIKWIPVKTGMTVTMLSVRLLCNNSLNRPLIQ